MWLADSSALRKYFMFYGKTCTYISIWFTIDGELNNFDMMVKIFVLCFFVVDDVVVVSCKQEASDLLANTIRSPSREGEKHKHILIRVVSIFLCLII